MAEQAGDLRSLSRLVTTMMMMGTIAVIHADYHCAMRFEDGDDDDGDAGNHPKGTSSQNPKAYTPGSEG